MKKHPIFLLAFLCLGSITIFPGCSKDDPKPECKIITITPDAGAAFNVSYNAEGKVSTITSGTSVSTYAYSGNTVIVTRTTSGTFSSRQIVTYNANGLASNVKTENNESGTSWDNLAFEFSGTEVVKQTQTSSGGGAPSVTTLTWSGGNPTVLTSGSSVTNVEYYTDKPAQTGDYWNLLQLTQGYTMVKAKNPIKSVLSGSSITTLNYVFDGDGKITSLSATSGSSTSTYNYQHQCN